MKKHTRFVVVALSLALLLVASLVFAAYNERNLTSLLSDLKQLASRYGADNPPNQPPHPGMTLNPQSDQPHLASKYGTGNPPHDEPPRPGITQNLLSGLPHLASRYGSSRGPNNPGV